MASPLEEFLIEQIKANGPMSVAEYMGHALGHPEYGYYMTRDPLGAAGDFTTAPEVSQLFGEMIGAWAADVWAQMGAPEDFVLLECGPGRGTLMADIMRVAANVPGFVEAAQLCLLEMSPVLRGKQAEVLAEYEPIWVDGLDDIPSDKPLIVIGNEFLDALPFQQFVKGLEGWSERFVDFQDGAFCFVERKIEGGIPFRFDRAGAGEIFEYAPMRNQFVSVIEKRIARDQGAALFIDYGHVRSACGDTLQAVKDHQYVDALEAPGEADMTSHVDFEQLVKGVSSSVHGPVRQGEFLRRLGIEVRAEMLLKNANEAQAAEIKKALHRLTGVREMGELFKVVALSSGLNPAGF